jgi:VCBS repeat-containing protein
LQLAQDARVPVITVTPAAAAVHEAGLALVDVAAGDATGSNPGAPGAPVHTTGAFTIDGRGESVTLSIVGMPVTLNASSVGAVFEGVYGVLSITGISTSAGVTTVSYAYDLTNNRLGAGGDDFALSVTDATGDTVVQLLHIDIVDDVPVARNDIDAGVASAGTLIAGNVVTGLGTQGGLNGDGADSLGADDAAVAGLTAGTAVPTASAASSYVVAGAFGELTLYLDGSYSYRVGTASPGDTDVFTYLLRDADGSTSSATLEIHLTAAGAGRFGASSLAATEMISDRDVLALEDLVPAPGPSEGDTGQQAPFSYRGSDGHTLSPAWLHGLEGAPLPTQRDPQDFA